MSNFQHFLKIDKGGYLLNDEGPIKNQEVAKHYLENVKMNERGFLKTLNEDDENMHVEAFDAPYVVQSLELNNNQVTLHMHYDFQATMNLESLVLDDWDRFYGLTDKNVPFVLTENAQDEFFNILDEFADDYIIFQGKKYNTPYWLIDRDDINTSDFWTNRYDTENTPWELDEPSPALVQTLPQLKLQKLRVLVLGSGTGHDAAHLAELGHIVTAVDFSEQAIERSKKQFSHISNLTFLKEDIFNLPEEMKNSFDLIFEHTCYCAVSPKRRDELVNIWRDMLTENGHLLGVFFTRVLSAGPPYGGNEFEYEKRLSPYFQFLYWTRWRTSVPSRQGIELLIYARLK